MLRTRVGYTGGERQNPTYRSLGDHTEALQVDFDPEEISYAEILRIFWKSHNPCALPWSTQYKAAIYYHDDTQRQVAEQTRGELLHLKGAVTTDVLPANAFYLAEDYHQKYRLRGLEVVERELTAIYPKLEDFVDSTAAARINAWVAGDGTREQFERELPRLGLSDAARDELKRVVSTRLD